MKETLLKLLILLPLLLSNSHNSYSKFIDNSAGHLLPKEYGKTLDQFYSFSVNWWNFLIIENAENPIKTCLKLEKDLRAYSLQMICEKNLKSISCYLDDWIKDSFKRVTAPSMKDFFHEINQSTAYLSLIASSNKDLFNLIRKDPLKSHSKLLKIFTNKKEIIYKEKITSKTTGKFSRFVVPIQFNYPPTDISKNKKIFEIIGENRESLFIVGPHASNFENQSLIFKDTMKTTIFALVIFLILVVYLFVTKRYKFFYLIPVLALSTLLTTFITIIFFKSIHGLTISFGIGIIGLSFDYGLHSIFCQNKELARSANKIGLLTTLIVLFIISLSSLPVLKQMMFFGIVGLSLAYIFLYLIENKLKHKFKISPLQKEVKLSKKLIIIPLVLIISIFILPPFVKTNFSLSQFDYKSQRMSVLQGWLFSKFNITIPLFSIKKGKFSDKRLHRNAQIESNWAKDNSIFVENISTYLPSPAVQSYNLKSWDTAFCHDNSFFEKLLPYQKKLFSPFKTNLNCPIFPSVKNTTTPKYITHLESNNNWLTLWFPKNLKEKKQIEKIFKKTISLKNLMNNFPKLLVKEMKWMMPLTLILVSLFLFFYYKKFIPTLLSMIPFMCALGFVLIQIIIAGSTINFITLISFLMIYGLSVDYGIFATDAYYLYSSNSHKKEVISALIFASITTAGGFLPLIFCEHPVLKTLGITLTCGIIGTLIGSVIGIPTFANALKRLK